MSSLRLTLIAPLASIVILMLGLGVSTTITTLDLKSLEASHWLIGAVSSSYFIGLVAGSYYNQRLILRIGHIRAFCVFASVLAATFLAQGIIDIPVLWIIARFIFGYCQAGTLVITESWLLALSQENNRGTILSLYMVAYYVATGLGQLLLNSSSSASVSLYSIITILIALSILPVALTRFHAPSPDSPHVLSLKRLLQKTPVAVIGSFVGGLMLGAIYSLFPLFLAKIGKNFHEISYIMMSTIIGGGMLQYPLGRASDKIDRRKILLLISFLSLAVFILIAVTHPNTYALMFWAFLMGGFSFTIYPISISHCIDYLSNEEILAATALMLLIFGVGMILAPLIEPLFTLLFGEYGFFIYLCTVLLPLIISTIYYITIRRTLTPEEKSDFVTLPQTTPEVTQLDPAMNDGSQEKAQNASQPQN